MNDSDGLFFQAAQKIGFPELSWVATRGEELQRQLLLGRMIRWGLVTGITRRHTLGRAWQVHDSDDDGTVTIRAGGSEPAQGRRRLSALDPAVAVDADGYLLVHESDASLVVPDDNTWYTLVAYWSLDEYEPGTITVTTGSPTIAGSGTKFTQLAGKTSYVRDGAVVVGFGRGDLLEIKTADSVNGNGGVIEIDTITSDTSLTLVTAPAGTNEAGLPWRIASAFKGTPPADRQGRQYRRVAFKLVARTRDPGTEANGSTQIILADVKRNSAGTPEVAIIDRRAANMLMLQEGTGRRTAMSLLPVVQYGDIAGGAPAASYMTLGEMYDAGANGIADADMAQTVDGSVLSLVVEDTGSLVRSAKKTLQNTDAPPAKVTVNASGARCALLQIPGNSGAGHLAFYTSGGQVYQRATTDDGATWGAAVLVWDPTAIDASDAIGSIDAVLLLSHRIVLAGIHFDDSAAAYSVRYVYSDDYGVTWTTNTNAGYPVLDGDAVSRQPADVCIEQAPDGTIWVAASMAANAEIWCWSADDDTGIVWTTVDTGGGTSITDLGFVSARDSITAVYRPQLLLEEDGTFGLLYQYFEDEVVGADFARVAFETWGADDTDADARAVGRVNLSHHTLFDLDTQTGQSAVDFYLTALHLQGGQVVVAAETSTGLLQGFYTFPVKLAVPTLPVNAHNNP